MMYRMALPLLAFLGAGACNDQGVTGPPVSAHAPEGVSSVVSSSMPSFVRSGAVNVTKECSEYTGQAGDICTITASNLRDLPAGTTITYASPLVWPNLDTDVVIDPPGPGNNQAFGHCTLSLETGIGTCTFSGGTGKFTHLQGSVAVSSLGGANFAWNGSYRYAP